MKYPPTPTMKMLLKKPTTRVSGKNRFRALIARICVVVVGVGGLLEALGFLLFPAEDLDDHDAGQVFLQPGGNVAEPVAGGGVDRLDLLVEDPEQEVNNEQAAPARCWPRASPCT